MRLLLFLVASAMLAQETSGTAPSKNIPNVAQLDCLSVPVCRAERLHTLQAKIETIQARFNGELQAAQKALADKYQPLVEPLLKEQTAIQDSICKEAKIEAAQCVVDDKGVASKKPDKEKPTSTQ